MKYLLFANIILCCFITSKAYCSTDTTANEKTAKLFNATIETYDHTLSGIMVINKESDDKYRVLFTTIAGPKLLDMYITKDNYEKIFAIKKLDKKIILKFFQKDFATLLALHRSNSNKIISTENDITTETIPALKKDTVHYTLTKNVLQKAIYKSKSSTLFEINYSYNSLGLDEILLQQHNFSMSISLKAIER